LVTEASRSSGSEPTAPIEGVVAVATGTVDDAATKEATTKKRAVDADAVGKVAADRATAERVVVVKAIIDDRAAERAVAKKTMTGKSVVESVGPNSTLALASESKRVATPSDSTPSQKQFHGA
jgi:hypothetical protein